MNKESKTANPEMVQIGGQTAYRDPESGALVFRPSHDAQLVARIGRLEQIVAELQARIGDKT